MKKILVAFLLFSGLFFHGCKSKDSNDPKSVLTEFFDAVSKKDVAKARTLATADSKAMLDMMEMGLQMSNDSAKDTKFDMEKMEFGDANIEGDKAVIPVKEKTTGDMMNYTLKKEKGVWKVAFDKSSLMGSNMDKLKGATDSLQKMDIDQTMNMDSLKDAINDDARMDTLLKMKP